MVIYSAYEMIAPALFAVLSACLSFVIVYDIWMFHREASYSLLYQESSKCILFYNPNCAERKEVVFYKIILGLFLAVCSFVMLVASQTLRVQFQHFSASSGNTFL